MFYGVVLAGDGRAQPPPEGGEDAKLGGGPVGGGSAEAGKQALLSLGSVDVGLDMAHGSEGLVQLAGADELGACLLGRLAGLGLAVTGEGGLVVAIASAAGRGAPDTGWLALVTFYSADSGTGELSV